MFIRKLIVGLLTFYTVEIRKTSLKNDNFESFGISTERLLETIKKKEVTKKKTRLGDKRKWKAKKKFVQQTYKIKGTNPKDARFSNQQKLRRMYRSM